MNPLGTRRAAEQLSRALDGDVTALPAGAASLAALGQRLRVLGGELETVAAPREDFRAALRTRLVAVATVQPVAPPAAVGVRALLGSPGQKAVGVAAGALASVVAVSGVAVASVEALPGDPFYGVKRTAEGLQLRLAGDGVEAGDRHLQLAATRLDEVRELTLGRDVPAAGASAAADADWGLVRQTLADMDDETRTGSELLEQAWLDDRDEDVLALLSEFAAEQAAELSALLPVMAAEARVDAEASLELVASMAAATAERLALVPCTEGCSSGGSTGDGDCDCGGTPAGSPPSSAGPSASPSGPASPPAGATPPSLPTTPPPGAASSSAPTGSSSATPRPVPTLPTLPPSPTPLPTELPDGLPTDLSTGLSTSAPTGSVVPPRDTVSDDLGAG